MSTETDVNRWTLNCCMIARPYKNLIWIWIDFDLCDLPQCVLDCHFMKPLCDAFLAYGTYHLAFKSYYLKPLKKSAKKKKKKTSVLHFLDKFSILSSKATKHKTYCFMKAIFSHNSFSSWSIKKTFNCQRWIIKLWKLLTIFWTGKNMNRTTPPSSKKILWIHLEKTVRNYEKLLL